MLPDLAALPQPLVVVLHDAGAANLAIGWLKAFPQLDFRVVAEGPARHILDSEWPDRVCLPLDDALIGAGLLLSGTGWQSDLEFRAREAAQARGIRSIAIVDHWVNYRERFVRGGVEILPDELWVSDHNALRIAEQEFAGIRVNAFANVYLDNAVEKVRRLDVANRLSSGDRILYALEPIRTTWSTADVRPGEFQALDYFLSRMDTLGISEDAEIRLRPHPSDPPGKYESWIAAHAYANVRLAPDEPIENAVHWSTCVAACESFVLIMGAAAGRRAVSTLPPWGPKLQLPHQDIVRLCNI